MTYETFPFKRLETIARERKVLADAWRQARRDNPRIARMVWRRARQAAKEQIARHMQSLFYGS